jgi:hypothetical protein
MRYVCLLALILPALFSAQASAAQDGAAIYKERCASGRDCPAERVSSLTVIKAMSGEAIYAALSTASMKSRAEGLAITEMFAGHVPNPKLKWAFTGARGAPASFFGDRGALVYALDHFATTVTAAARFYKGAIYRSLSVILVFDLMFFIQSRKRDLL